MKKFVPYILPIIVIVGIILSLNYGLARNQVSNSAPDLSTSNTDTQTPSLEPTKPDPQLKQGDKPAVPPINKAEAGSITILMYHEIGDGASSLYVPVEKFSAQMNYLAQSGYHTVTMAEAQEMLASGHIPAKTIVLTFDDGYVSFYTKAWPIMQEHGFTGTMYVCSSFSGLYNYLTWEEIKTIQTQGIEIGSHTRNHTDLKKASASVQSDEILGSKQKLEEELGVPVKSFCYPSGVYSPSAIQVVKDAGYTSAVTVEYGYATAKNNFYLIPRVRVPGWMTLANFAKSIP